MHVIEIGANIPGPACLKANAHALARFAALSQAAGLVPIVEPEVLMDGDHTIERHFEVTETILKSVFQLLFEHRVDLGAMLVKPNMVLAGTDCPQQALHHRARCNSAARFGSYSKTMEPMAVQETIK